MFTQYNIFEKLLRILIFSICVYIILSYISKEELIFSNKINLVMATTVIFIFYEMYFPSVKIELEKNSR